MTLASELKQRQDIARDPITYISIEKNTNCRRVIRQTSEYGYSPDLPVQVIVDCLKDTSLAPPSEYECIGYEFMEKDGEYHIYRRIFKGSIRLLLKILNGQSKIFLMFIILVLIR